MKKIVSCILCLTLVVTTALGISTPVMAKSDDNDGVEQFKEEQIFAAGSSFGEATDISVNSIVTDNLESSSDKNYYKFTIDADGYVSFDFNHEYVDGDNSRWYLQFYDLNEKKFFGEYLYGNVDESITETTKNVGIPAGTYYLSVTTGNSYSGALYRLRVNYTEDAHWEKEFNDQISTADRISLGEYYYGSLKESSDKDYYCFSLEQSGIVNIDFIHDYVDGDNSRWRITLYDINEDAMITNYYYGNVPQGSVDKSCNIGLPSGKYYIKIETANSYTSANYGICIDYNQNNNYETEWNNLFSMADEIKAGQNISGNLMTSSDKDYYYFRNQQDGVVSFDFSHEYVDGNNSRWILTLYDEYEQKIWQEYVYGNDVNTYSRQDYLSAGKYYVGIATANSSTDKAYSMNVDFDDSDGTSQTMYRLYNPNSGEHFYTGSITERNNLTNVGWKYEGVAWHAPFESGIPVYRLYNPNTGDHHYTTGEGERDHLSSVGWKYEGIGWYSDESETTALHRLYNPNATGAGSHHYTTNMEEADNLTRIGWKYEGIGWYGV